MRTTQQDIADYLKISRLTVSKALNYASGVSEETRNLILSTAKQLGYRHISERQMQEAEVPSEQEGNVTMSDLKQICLFSNLNCTTDSYWAPVISGMVRTLTKRGYNLNLCFLDLSEDTDFEFPINFNPRTASGIIQLGNFKKHHIRRIRECGLPVVAVAGFDNLSESLAADLTTVSVNREELGMSAAETILWRIENPERPYRVIRISGAELIVRNSTSAKLY